ncbi:MAG: hypothetical protein AAF599_15685, partial [Bacteroidota bacterium]
EIRILADKEVEFHAYDKHSISDIASLSREETIQKLTKSGAWVNLTQRPYGTIANPSDQPKAIFISDPKKIKNTNQRDDIITLLFSNRAIVDEQLQEKFAKKTAPTAKVGNFKALNYKVDEIFIMPFVFFFALLLITPITWKRKLIAGTIGFAALTLFQIGFICTLAWDKISNAKIGVYELSTEQYQWLDRLNAPLATSGIILIPVLIWAMVSFRKDDWQQLKLFS